MDIQEFKHTTLPFKAKLFRLAKMMLGNSREEAEDVVQDVYVKLWEARTELKKYNSIEAFAMRMAKNLCLDRLKSKRYTGWTELDNAHLQHAHEKTPQFYLEMQDIQKALSSLLDKLPEQQKLLVHLRDVEGYAYEEIESITGLSVNNIRVNLSRARMALREQYVKIN